MTHEPQVNEPVPPRPRSLPLLLDEEWEAPPRSRTRVAVIAAFTGVALIVSCVALLTSRDRTWEPGDNSSWVTKRVTGSLSHGDPSEPTGVFEAPPPPPPPPPPVRPPSPEGRGGQGVRTKGRGGQGVRTPPAGYLSINSSPWAQVSVDGRVVGTTPQVKIRLTAGRHHLLLVREGFQAHSAWVIVPTGGTVRLTDITLAATTR
jgi:hypothetical protein